MIKGKFRRTLKIWIKLIIAGIVLFFAGIVYIIAMGGLRTGSEGMIISYAGIVLTVIGVVAGIIRGFRRMMSE